MNESDMRLVGIMPVRNEDWVLPLSLRAALMWMDEICILDHCSTDRTMEIIAGVARESVRSDGRPRIHCWQEKDPVWREMAHRNFLLREARALGATHIGLVDADEVLSGNLLPTIRHEVWCNGLPGFLLQLPWVCLARGVDKYYSEGTWFDAIVSTAFPDAPELHWSAYGQAGYDFHHRHPMGRQLTPQKPVRKREGGLMHLQFVDERRLKAKQKRYKLIERIRWPDRSDVTELNVKYGRAIYESDPRRVRCAEVPKAWWEPYGHLLQYLSIGTVPWQEADNEMMMTEHGPELFAGLDLFD